MYFLKNVGFLFFFLVRKRQHHVNTTALCMQTPQANVSEGKCLETLEVNEMPLKQWTSRNGNKECKITKESIGAKKVLMHADIIGCICIQLFAC